MAASAELHNKAFADIRMNGLSWLIRISVFAGLWSILTTGDPASWVIGAPVVLLTAYFSWSLKTTESFRVSPLGLARYLAFFVVESVRGGVDVARRALLPGQQINPHFLNYCTSLPTGLPRVWFANTVNLLPGTLTANIEGDRFTIHALATDMRPLEGIRACEQRVAAVFVAGENNVARRA